MDIKNQLKIGIDARLYGPKQKGLGRYVQKMIEQLEKIDQENQYVIFLRKDNFNQYQPINPNFKKVLANAKWYGIKEQFLMPFKIWQNQIDLIHFPHFNVPIICLVPFVVTIHDLILKKYPTQRASFFGPIRYWIKNIGYDFVISSALKKSQKVITISNYTKKNILKYFKINSDKIKVIYEGTPDSSSLPEKKTKDPYLLYVGNAYPHKNLRRLILAFKELSQERDLKLILVGEIDYFYQQLRKEFSHLKNIVFADFVSDQELISLYQNASLYVFPSLCEGFGLPPLEAMSHGLPVISSSATCLPEILGQAALYFNPNNSQEIIQRIKEVLDDKKLQEKLISSGFKKIKEYSWNEMSKEILKIYQSVD